MKKILIFLILVGIIFGAVKYLPKFINKTPKNTPVKKADSDNKTQDPKKDTKQIKKTALKVELLDQKENTDAIYLYKNGKLEKAVQFFKKDIADKEKQIARPRNIAYLAKSYQYLNDTKKAEKAWNYIISKYPNSRYYGDAKYYFAKKAQKEGLVNTAIKLLKSAGKYSEISIGGGKAAMELAEYYRKKGAKWHMWVWYSKALRNRDTNKKAIKKILDPIVEELFYSDKMPGRKTYSVMPGDNLTKIARKYNTSIGLICKLNKKSNTYLNIGEELSIIPGKLMILVSKRDYFLSVFMENGLYLQGYEVGLGKDNKTPVGTFYIRQKQKNPPWYTIINGKRVKIPFEDKRNPLGTRWMGFKYRGFGIHGTKEPDSIGKNRSNGCVRMRNEEVEKLFQIIPRGTEVIIRP